MPEEKNNVIFGAEFDGTPVKQGVEDVLDSLDKAREAEALLKQSIKETTDAMKENRKEADKLSKSLALNANEVEENRKKVDALDKEYDELVSSQAKLTVAQKKVNEVSREYSRVQREQIKNSNEVNKAVGKFTNVNAIAADGIKKFGNFAKDAAFGLLSGFAGGIISQAIPALISFVDNLFDVQKELDKFKEQQKILDEVTSSAAKSVGDDVAKLEIFKQKLNDTNIPAAERVKIAKEYNKTADETNKIDLKQIDNLGLINTQIEKQNKLILQRAVSVAALSKLTEESTKFVDAQLKVNEALKRANLTEEQILANAKQNYEQEQQTLATSVQGLDNYSKAVDKNIDRRVEQGKKINTIYTDEQARIFSLINTRDLAKKSLDELGSLLSPLITAEGLTTVDRGAGTKGAKEIENVFRQKLLELQARLASASASVFQSEGLIREKFEAQFNKELFEIAKLLKDKKLTVEQADLLNAVLKQINDVELSKSLEEFRKKRTEALDKVNDAILQATLEAETKRINNLRDEFQREREQIDVNYQETVEQIKKRSADFMKQIDEETSKGLLSPALARRKKMIAAFMFGDLLDQAAQAKANAEIDLAFKTFNDTLNKAKTKFDQEALKENEDTTKLIREQTGLFMEGKINYEQYQKNLTAILKREAKIRRDIQLAEAEDQLDRINKQLAATTDPKQLEQLEKQRDILRGQISTLRRDIATGSSDDKNADEKTRLDNILKYVRAVNDLANSVIQFWQQVNAAEAAALDRSIALQNTRVENARQLAENGNAEYLEMEQKRLDELEKKREDAARKEIAINNALATSNAIVAAISAIAQAARSGSPLAAIAAVAAVISAIGAAYSFVNSLQPQEPGFYEGEEYVSGRGVKPGKDQVKARLHVGERVVTARENQDYWDTLSAIHNRTIPPDALNSFVQGYPKTDIPVVDFDRLSVATDGKLSTDNYELIGRVEELNDTMNRVVVGLDEMGINVNLDENGFEASISKARKRRLLRNRS